MAGRFTTRGAWLCVLLGAAPASAPKLPPLNEKVVEFARSNVGKRVGDGICITLAKDALVHAGARRVRFNDPRGDYVWGKEVASYQDALPGDILQFRDAVFEGKRLLTKKRYQTWHQEYPHHTAIVAGVKDGGKLLTILHQNVSGAGRDEEAKKTVREDVLRMDSLQKGGWVRVYRPVAPEDDASDER